MKKKNLERLSIYLKGRDEPISFDGEYRGHKRPDGVITENWHYYVSVNDIWYHFRKNEIQLVVSKQL